MAGGWSPKQEPGALCTFDGRGWKYTGRNLRGANVGKGVKGRRATQSRLYSSATDRFTVVYSEMVLASNSGATSASCSMGGLMAEAAAADLENLILQENAFTAIIQVGDAVTHAGLCL